ncbi:MAG TPA: hypothetical protein VMF06_11890 [Candidatus Limnocylindria bacterium]|nr:hypothetical protein [Candidatus Limnocylindria bacterium]
MNRFALGQWLPTLAAIAISVPLLVEAATLPNPILFVTQVPVPGDFTTVGAVFGNHKADLESVSRGGDLWIRYPDETLRNLTKEAGFGQTGLQGTNAIAVREPSVHWSGKKALFSMVIGAPKKQYEVSTFYWQIYEITGLGKGEKAVITKLPNQPANFNNVSPIYGSDNRILFTSDRPRDGLRHTYPQLDEYEEAPTVSGLWSLDPATGDLFLLNHSPSGVFSPKVDSFGRVVFVRWDHLQRDQQADTDNEGGTPTYYTFNYNNETASALILTNNRAEIFPESRIGSGRENPHTFNQFFPWMIHQDGTEEETLNHIGRQELGGSYRSTSFNDDPNLQELYDFSSLPNTNIINNFLQIRESVSSPGLYYGIDAPEFSTHAAGQIIALHGRPDINPDQMKIDYLTPRATSSFTEDGQLPPPSHTGLYRNPLPLSDGQLAAIHTPETRADKNAGTGAQPKSRYDFRLKLLQNSGGTWSPGAFLTPGLSNSVSWWDPDAKVAYSGLLWELDPVEVRASVPPTPLHETMGAPEQAVFAEENVDTTELQEYLRERSLALIISRDVTTRDHKDKQQPFNLRVPGGVQTIGKSGKVYDVAHFQLYQGDLLRGKGLYPNNAPQAGRRVLAQRQHEPLADNPPDPSGPPSSVAIATDGSIAAFVPARRAMSWQITAPDGSPVVRERYWITFQPGEIRTCTSCHGVNSKDQAGHLVATNKPLALRELLRYWKDENFTQPLIVTNSGTAHLAIAFKHQANLTNVTHSVEASDNLSLWQPGSVYQGTNAAAANGVTTEVSRSGSPNQTIVVRDNLPLGARTNRFLRVKEKVN